MMRQQQGRTFRTALGWAGVAASGRGVTQIVLPRKDRTAVERLLGGTAGTAARRNRLLRKAVRVLTEYFSGGRAALNLPLDLREATTFQKAVWRAAASIPAGETRSYAWVARAAGSPQAARAVGQVMAANPVPVLIP